MKRYVIGTMVGLLIVSASFGAWAMDGTQGGGGRHGPSPEAIEACRDKSEGAAVEFANRRGETVKATCKEINGQLAAVRERGSHGRNGTPTGGTQSGQ